MRFFCLFTILAVLVSCTGIADKEAAAHVPSPADLAYGRAMVYLAWSDGPTPTPPVKPSKPDDRGSRPPNRMLTQPVDFWAEYEWATWCAPCVAWKKDVMPELIRKGYKIKEIDRSTQQTPYDLPRFTFHYKDEIGSPYTFDSFTLIGAVDAKTWGDRYNSAWASRPKAVHVMEFTPETNDIWSAVGNSMQYAESKLPARPSQGDVVNPKTPAEIVTVLMSALNGSEVTVADGINVTSSATINMSVRRYGDSVIVQFNEPKPQVTAQKVIRMKTSIDSFTITQTEVSIQLARVPKFLEPTFPLK